MFSCGCWEFVVRPIDIDEFLDAARKRYPGLTVQVFAAGREPNLEALEMIATQTLEAARSGSTLAEKPELDLLLRLAGTRQIGEAFGRAGYSSGKKRLFLVAAGKRNSNELRRIEMWTEKDKRFVKVKRTKMRRTDLGLVERAALLAARV